MASTRKRLEALTAGLSLPPAELDHAGPVPPAAAMETQPLAAVAVETRFPPAVTGPMAPRTGPGQMMAFRGQIQQVEGEMAALRDKLRQYEGALPTRKLDPRTIRPSSWANRHASSFNTSEFAGLKADIEHAGGNVQPILVRPLTDEAGQYELVFGHRRHQATLELGIPVLASIWTEELSDRDLFAAMDRENRERADLSPYEQGVMYQRALEAQLFPTQRQLAENLGVSHTWVRKALIVAQLPPAVVDVFRSPLEISFRHAEQINAAMDKDRKGVLKRVEKLRGQNLPAATVLARLLDVNANFQKLRRIEVEVAGAKAGVLSRSAAGDVTVTLAAGLAATASTSALGAAIGEALERLRRLDA